MITCSSCGRVSTVSFVLMLMPMIEFTCLAALYIRTTWKFAHWILQSYRWRGKEKTYTHSSFCYSLCKGNHLRNRIRIRFSAGMVSLRHIFLRCFEFETMAPSSSFFAIHLIFRVFVLKRSEKLEICFFLSWMAASVQEKKKKKKNRNERITSFVSLISFNKFNTIQYIFFIISFIVWRPWKVTASFVAFPKESLHDE